MTDRQQDILTHVIEEYIKNAQPIGSSAILETGVFDVSGATIRNELSALEQDGYLTHPHTSAGRMPTEQGYRLYVSELMRSQAPKKPVKDILSRIKDEMDTPVDIMKQTAKCVAEVCSTAVIVEMQRGSIYYTGLSHLFSQPEFHDYAKTLQVSELFDECEMRVPYIDELVENDEIHIFIGEGNPLGRGCTTLAMRTRDNQLFMLFGPLRMQYKTNFGIMKYLREII